MRTAPAVLALLLGLPTASSAQQTVPVLRYQPPANWYRSADVNPEAYSSNEVNAGVQIYRFRRIDGDLMQMLGQDLLRRWIDPQFAETSIAAQPAWTRDTIPGAEAVYNVQFSENVVGILHPHVRTVVVSHGYAAIMDAPAGTPESWQRASATLAAVYHTLRVEQGPAPPSVANGPGPLGRQVAGLYMGTKAKYVVNLVSGGGDFKPALHYFLFSADGWVYRRYDFEPTNYQHFDFAMALREDPVNTGRYTVSGGELYLQFGEGPDAEVITAPLPRNGRLEISSVVYQRQ
jgi:hypothetical protein